MQDTRRELEAAGLDPLFHLHIWLFVKAKRETPDFIGCKFGRLSVNFAFVILLDTLRPFHSFKRVKEIRVYYAILLLNSKEGVGQYGSLFALTRPNWNRHSSFFLFPRSPRWVADLWPASSAGPQQLVLPVRQRVPYAPVWGIKTCSWHSCGMKISGEENLVN